MRAPPRRFSKDVGERVAVRKIAPEILQDGDQRIERRADLVGVGRGDVFPDVGRAGREPRRIGESFAGECQAVRTDGVAHDTHQRTGRQLREMTEKGE